MNRRPRKIVIAPNAFKGTLTAVQAANAIARGLHRSLGKNVSLIRIPMADGGDGFADVIVAATHGQWLRRQVRDPLGKRISAAFGISRDKSTAVIELARASGLTLLRNPDALHASTRGTGQLIRAALDLGVSRIIVGIGGSATTDGGMGLSRALGVRFLDVRGREVPEGGMGLLQLATIELTDLDPRVKAVTIDVACDVDNPLLGPRGAARVFGPQKGATPAMVAQLEKGLRQLAKVMKRDVRLDGRIDVRTLPGGGAAGGTGAALAALFEARLRPGVEIVMEAIDLRGALKGADLVITGEGRLDGQTAGGKVPAGVLRMARELGVPVAAMCGSVAKGVGNAGFDAVFVTESDPLRSGVIEKKHAAKALEKCAQDAGRALLDL